MLRREEAEKRLQKFRIKNWKKGRVAAFGRLPAKLCAIGRGLLQCNRAGKPIREWNRQHEAQQDALDELSKLYSAERQKLFSVLFPKLGRHVEGAWQLMGRLPYETSYERKGFRAPNDPEVLKTARSARLRHLIEELTGYDPDAAWLADWAPFLGYNGGYAVRLILDHNLVRFSATIRAVDVWFGLGWDAVSTGVVKRTLETVLNFLEDEKARKDALANSDPETTYLALWTLGFEDTGAAVKPAARLLTNSSVERRFVAAHFLRQLDLPAARAELVRCLDDEELRIALHALDGISGEDSGDYFESIRRLLERVPQKPAQMPALVWPWMTIHINRAGVADQLVRALGDRPISALTPYIHQMSCSGRSDVVNRVVEEKKFDDAVRDTLFALVGDTNNWLRERVLKALKKCAVGEADALRLEGFLTRKNGDMRRAVLTVLKRQKTPSVLTSADRLLASKKPNQRLGGLELLRQLVESKRAVAECRQRAEQYQIQRPRLGEEEQLQIDAILDIERVVPKLDDALGLLGDLKRTPAVSPKTRKVTFLTPAAIACLSAIDELLKQHQETTISVITYQGPQEELLANVNPWSFPAPNVSTPVKEDAARFPLREVWEKWLGGRPRALRDKDGLELVRAFAWCNLDEKSWKAHLKQYGKEWGGFLKTASAGLTPPRLRHGGIVHKVLQWLLRLHPADGAMDFLLDAVETAFVAVPEKTLARVVDVKNWQQRQRDWRNASPADYWLDQYNSYRGLRPEDWKDEHQARLWQLLHWRDEPVAGVARFHPNLDLLLSAYQAGIANDADVLDQLLNTAEGFNDLQRVTALQPPAEAQKTPGMRSLIDRCRARILEVELARGEMPTAASEPARHIGSLYGLDTLLRLLTALGKKSFSRSSYGLGRTDVLTHLLRVTQPSDADTPEEFAVRTKQAGIARERLLELAFLASQWLKHVEHALGWEGLREGAWWFLAHMPGGRAGLGSSDDEEYVFDEDDLFDEDEEDAAGRTKQVDLWERLIQERTSLTRQERADGAVDADWFRRAYAPLGKKRWLALAAGAKFGCTGQGHKKAIHLAEVLLGRAKKGELIAGIRQRQLRDSVRLLGLLPLAAGDKREKDLLVRYRVIQEYRRYARGLSPMSRESAIRTGDMGLENLARTAGYPDSVRLEWAMEAKEIADLAAGPIAATHQGVTVTLSLDEQSQPLLTVRRGDKPLKNIPPAVRKHRKIAMLADRKTELKRQASRMRHSLENAMCRGDTFTGAELRTLFDHPILVPSLERLVLIGEDILGYPTAKG
jgi:hypothetical protein